MAIKTWGIPENTIMSGTAYNDSLEAVGGENSMILGLVQQIPNNLLHHWSKFPWTSLSSLDVALLRLRSSACVHENLSCVQSASYLKPATLDGDDIIRWYAWAGWQAPYYATIDGGSGNDRIYVCGYGLGNTTSNTVFCGDGNDYVEGYSGSDTVYGGTGDDIVYSGDNNDVLVGASGNDWLYGQAGDDKLTGDASDIPVSVHGADYISGGEGNDHIWGNAGDDTLIGGEGNDSIGGNEDNDYINGGDGYDYLYGGLGDDTMYGGSGSDNFQGNEGNDLMYGGEGDDNFVGGHGGDTVWGGNDNIYGDASDIDVSLHGADWLYGDVGDDRIFGYAGNDSLGGGAGEDWLEGGAGNDSLWGCDGRADGKRDVFVLRACDGNQADEIMDFESGVDAIYVPDACFIKAELHGNDLWAYVSNDSGIIIHNAVGKTLSYQDASANYIQSYKV